MTSSARTLRPRLFRWLALALALLFTGPLAAAQRTRFDPQRHLDGYAAVLISEYRDLYRLQEFERFEGHVLPDERLDELRQAWRVERERVAAQIEGFRRQPRTYVLYRLQREMLVHPAFSRITTHTFETHDPFLFLIQSPRTQREGYEEEIVESLGSDLQAAEALFREEFVEPLGLEQRQGHAAHPVIVLAGLDEYERYLRTLEGPALFFAQANYDAGLRAVVTYLEPDARPRRDVGLRRPVVHEAVLALLDAYASVEDRRPEPWIDEGLASYLSTRALFGEASQRPLDSLALEAMVEATSDPERRAGCLLDLAELATLHTYGQTYERMLRKAAAEGVGQPDYRTALLALYGQGATWVWFLCSAEEGALRKGLLAYLKDSLADRGGADAIRRAFDWIDLQELDRRYRALVVDTVLGWAEEATSSGSELEASFRLSDLTATLVRREAEERVDTIEALAPDRSEHAVQFAGALALARAGRFAAAAQEVQLLLAQHPDEPRAGRFRRELERMNAFRVERRRFLEHLLESDRKLNLMLDEGRLLASVLAVEDERVVLGDNRLHLDALELDAIDPVQLVKLMRSGKNEFPRDWIQAYPHVLQATGDAQRILEDESAEGAKALAVDVESGDYEQWFGLAEAVEILARLSEEALPERVEDARRALEDVRRLRERHGELDLVRVRKRALTQLAYRAQSLLFEEDGLNEVLHAKVERQPDGALRLTYDFDDPAQGQDFEPVSYLNGERWVGSPDPVDSQPFHVTDGVLAARGAACSRYLLDFEGSQLVRMRFLFRTPEGAFDNRIRALIGLCDDRAESTITCDMLGGLTVSDRGKSYRQQVEAQGSLFMDTEHTVEVVHDGGDKVRSTFDGQPAAEAMVGPRLSGSIFLWSNSECPFELVELVIEGRPTPASLRELRNEWVQQKMAALGF